MSTTITLSIDNLRGDDKAPLLCRYPNQVNAQPAFVDLDEDGEVSADYSATDNAVPMYVWQNRTLRWSVNPAVRGDHLAELLESETVQSLLARVHAGHTVDWDDSNHVGKLNADAQQASEKLEAIFQEIGSDECAIVYDAGDYLWTSCSLLDHWSGVSLDTAVDALKQAAERDNIAIIGDIRKELLDKAANKFDEDGDDGLDAHHLAALVAAERITQAEADVRNAERETDAREATPSN